MSSGSIKNKKSVEYGITTPHDNNCILEDINKIQEYLECSKINFENRLKQQPMNESAVGDFIFHKTIGMGAFGRVMLVNHKLKPEPILSMKVRNGKAVL
ncbi:unnamed protein product [Macrosiphum euphorbiae]|uniref:Uncharacterized protein n=1 Tax=Macrosiphum euphorbiae TaxID=13131 RepID=A0AAV0WK27_9HEMI|nr:unnamed protein product [Macrosiphum euphorbiae]